MDICSVTIRSAVGRLECVLGPSRSDAESVGRKVNRLFPMKAKNDDTFETHTSANFPSWKIESQPQVKLVSGSMIIETVG